MDTWTIKNGLLYDGINDTGFQADIQINNGRISKIGRAGEVSGQVLDARGMVVCPGFVDIHRHCDMKPLLEQDFGTVELMQGITTVVVGNCGMSMTPANPGNPKELYDFTEPVLGPVGNLKIYGYREYLKSVEQKQLPFNMASMVGTGSLRISLKGFSSAPYTKEELDRAVQIVEEAMKEGAAGVSVGIMYLPECYSSIEEFAEILKPAGRYGRVVTAHIRGEGDSLAESVAEIIEIGKRAACAVEISHFKSCGMENWRKDIHRAIALIEEARKEGRDVTCDFYPYEGGSTALTTMLPPAFVAGDMAGAVRRLGSPEGAEEFRKASETLYRDWDNYAVSLGWDRILISGVAEEKNRRFLGKTVLEAAEEFGFPGAAACAAYLMHEDGGKTAIINMSMCQEDIDIIAKLPYASVISDSIYADTDTPHPRMYGAFPKIIREYVLERGIYTMGEAVRRMSSMPANRMKLAGRGVLTVGAAADINIFDPAVFRDNATFTHPARLASGLEYCMVNGVPAIYKGKLTGEKPGRNIRVS